VPKTKDLNTRSVIIYSIEVKTMKINEKKKKYDKERYLKNRRSILDKNLLYQKNNRESVNIRSRRNNLLKKLELVNYKGGACQICGYNDCIAALDFHHNIGDKEFNIGTELGKSCKLSKLKQEVDKCILVCSNCHRKIHYNEVDLQ